MSNEVRQPEEDDLQYFADFKSFETIAPELEEKAKNFKLTDKTAEELKDDIDQDQGADERKKFAVLRSEKMSEEDYKEFVNDRGVGMLYKGKKALCKWLGVSKELSINKTLIELSSLIGKSALRRIIEEAIRKRSPVSQLHIIDKPLTLKEMKSSIESELKQIRKIVENVLHHFIID